MSKEFKEDLTLWVAAGIIAVAVGVMAASADAQDQQQLYLDNSVKVAPPPRPSVQTIVDPGEVRDPERDRVRHSHNEKRLRKNLDEHRKAQGEQRGERGVDEQQDDRDSADRSE
jgi:hypothetical protein